MPTEVMLAHAHLAAADVVELAPGLGRAANRPPPRRPRSYLGIERDREAARAVAAIVDGYGRVRVADAAGTGLSSGSADVVIGEGC